MKPENRITQDLGDYAGYRERVIQEVEQLRRRCADLEAVVLEAQEALDCCVSAMSGFEWDDKAATIRIPGSLRQFTEDFNAAIAAEARLRALLPSAATAGAPASDSAPTGSPATR